MKFAPDSIEALLSRVVEHVDGLPLLMANGDDITHAVKIASANARYALQEYRRQHPPADSCSHDGSAGSCHSSLVDRNYGRCEACEDE